MGTAISGWPSGHAERTGQGTGGVEGSSAAEGLLELIRLPNQPALHRPGFTERNGASTTTSTAWLKTKVSGEDGSAGSPDRPRLQRHRSSPGCIPQQRTIHHNSRNTDPDQALASDRNLSGPCKPSRGVGSGRALNRKQPNDEACPTTNSQKAWTDRRGDTKSTTRQKRKLVLTKAPN